MHGIAHFDFEDRDISEHGYRHVWIPDIQRPRQRTISTCFSEIGSEPIRRYSPIQSGLFPGDLRRRFDSRSKWTFRFFDPAHSTGTEITQVTINTATVPATVTTAIVTSLRQQVFKELVFPTAVPFSAAVTAAGADPAKLVGVTLNISRNAPCRTIYNVKWVPGSPFTVACVDAEAGGQVDCATF